MVALLLGLDRFPFLVFFKSVFLHKRGAYETLQTIYQTTDLEKKTVRYS